VSEEKCAADYTRSEWTRKVIPETSERSGLCRRQSDEAVAAETAEWHAWDGLCRTGVDLLWGARDHSLSQNGLCPRVHVV
jgi:hypothetical protein